jgi:hypothetical protein
MIHKAIQLFAVIIALCLLASTALADRVHLKDGRVLEGKILEEGEGYLVIEIAIGSIRRSEFVATANVQRIERDEDKPKAEPKSEPRTEPRDQQQPAKQPPQGQPKNQTQAAKTDNAAAGRPTRVAVLNFGPPAYWRDGTGDMVGVQASHHAFETVVPMLEADNVDVVVIRINSGGGLAMEVPKLQELFEEVYERKFRTVAWVEYAGSAAAMGPYTIDDFYFMPQGALGGCVMFSGPGIASTGAAYEGILHQMEIASALGNRDPLIMRAMQTLDTPLSADRDPDTGKITWRRDYEGEIKVNPPGRVLTLNAQQAYETGFSKGTAATREELMEVMGITEYVWAGERATRFIDDFMRSTTRTEQRVGELFTKYADAIGLAAAMPAGPQRRAEAGRARAMLSQLRTRMRENPNFALLYGTNDEWFEQQEELIRQLMRQ